MYWPGRVWPCAAQSMTTAVALLAGIRMAVTLAGAGPEQAVMAIAAAPLSVTAAALARPPLMMDRMIMMAPRGRDLSRQREAAPS
jgi:hypothetical protein